MQLQINPSQPYRLPCNIESNSITVDPHTSKSVTFNFSIDNSVNLSAIKNIGGMFLIDEITAFLTPPDQIHRYKIPNTGRTILVSAIEVTNKITPISINSVSLSINNDVELRMTGSWTNDKST